MCTEVTAVKCEPLRPGCLYFGMFYTGQDKDTFPGGIPAWADVPVLGKEEEEEEEDSRINVQKREDRETVTPTRRTFHTRKSLFEPRLLRRKSVLISLTGASSSSSHVWSRTGAVCAPFDAHERAHQQLCACSRLTNSFCEVSALHKVMTETVAQAAGYPGNSSFAFPAK